MPVHIGIVGGSAEGAALCYRTMCVEGAVLLGTHAHPEVSKHTPSLAFAPRSSRPRRVRLSSETHRESRRSGPAALGRWY